MNNLEFEDCGGNIVSVDTTAYNTFKTKMNGSSFNRTTALAVGKEVGLTARAIRFGVRNWTIFYEAFIAYFR